MILSIGPPRNIATNTESTWQPREFVCWSAFVSASAALSAQTRNQEYPKKEQQ